MFSLLLTLAISTTGQYNVVKPFWTVPPEVKDMVFTQIQEDWVYRQRKNQIYYWQTVLPQHEADLLDTLNAEKASVRRFGLHFLREMGMDAVRLCTWGCNSKSGELREVCNKHLIRLYTCIYCEGNGKVWRKFENYNPYEVKCRGCNGSGSFYWYNRWDLASDNEVWTRRDVFGPTEPRKPEDE